MSSFMKRFVLFFCTMLIGSFALTSSADAQIVRDFTARFSRNTPGDIALTGNSVLSCPPGGPNCADVQTGVISTGNAANNNAHDMVYQDVDSDASTFNSTSAIVSLPQNARVLWAGLYWGGRTRTGSNGTGAGAPDPTKKNEVKFRSPNSNNYVTLTASTCDDATGVGSDSLTGDVYQCFAQVTTQLPGTGNGTYTVANVQTGTGENRFGGWGIIIVYEDPSQPLRNLVVYDGFGLVLDQGMMGSVNINLSGFRSPASGDVISRIGAIAYEGDRGADGDSFRLDGMALADAFNDSGNFFNAGISRLGSNISQRNPAFINNLGFDLKLVEARNLLSNNSMSALLTLDTSGDNYFPGVVTFATELYAPLMSVTKTAEDINGAPVTVGDVLEYTITVRNDGGDAATLAKLEDIIPVGTSYVANSGSIDGSPRTDARDTDTWNFDAVNNTLSVNLGAGATSNTGGTIGLSTQTIVRFRVRINENLTEGTRVANQAVISYVTATLNVPSVIISDGDPVNPGADTTITVVENVPKSIDITSPQEGDLTLQRRPTISGTATPNSTVILTINGMMVTVTTDAQGNWSHTPSSDLPVGQVVVNASVQDSTAMDSVTFTVAESGVEIITPGDNDIITDRTPTITGMGTPGSTIEIVIDGGAPVTVVVNPDGTWMYTPDVDLDNGDHTVVVTIPGTDASDDVTFTISDDTVAITSPADGSSTSSRKPAITGTANPNSDVEVSINGGAAVTVTTDAQGNWSYTPDNDLPVGNNSVEATQGTASDSATFTITNDGVVPVDPTNPMVSIDSPADNADITPTPTINGSGTPGSTVEIFIDGMKIGETPVAEDGSWTFIPDAPITPGEHIIEAKVTIGEESSSDTVDIKVVLTDPRIVRGGSCATTGTGQAPAPLPFGLLMLLIPVGMVLGRKKKLLGIQLTAVLAVLGLHVERAQAQDESLTGFQVEGFEPLPSQPLNILNIGTSNTLPHLKPSFGLVSHWVNDPIQFSNPDGSNADKVIRNQVKAELNAAVGLFDMLELGLVAPIVMYQNGDDLVSFGQPGEAVEGAAIADFRVIPKITILPSGDRGFGLAALIPLYLPVGDEASFNSDGNFRLEPRLIADWHNKKEGGVRISANVAYQLLRKNREVANFVNTDMLRWGLGARVATPVPRLNVLGSAFGNISFEEARQIEGVDPDELNKSRPIELLGALEYGITRSVWASLGGGTGLTSGVGAPDFRVLLGVNYAPAAEPDAPPISDRDGDGIADELDQCPDQPEDFDTFEDEDGCPDPDNDKDDILDVYDECPMDPEDYDNFEDENGCPDPDNDQDKILDVKDECPDDPEDYDGFEDENGCPDPDNDEDGILDINDQCPMDPELFNGVEDEDGCPEKDTDKDGIIDPVDKCPTEPETYNGIDDDDGCPDGKQTVVITETEIKILEKVFFDTNKASIKKVSYTLLDTVVIVLKQNPQVTRIRIEGHTDDMGKDTYNLQLSKDRAAAVRKYLTDKGLDADRIESEGFGEGRPLCKDIPAKQLGKRSKKKAIKNCRADNRRVEFKIVELNGKRVEATDTVTIKDSDAP